VQRLTAVWVHLYGESEAQTLAGTLQTVRALGGSVPPPPSAHPQERPVDLDTVPGLHARTVFKGLQAATPTCAHSRAAQYAPASILLTALYLMETDPGWGRAALTELTAYFRETFPVPPAPDGTHQAYEDLIWEWVQALRAAGPQSPPTPGGPPSAAVRRAQGKLVATRSSRRLAR
jgi:hypothetical protein